MNGKNKRWLEQRWEARQPERLEHIRMKKLTREKRKEDKADDRCKTDDGNCGVYG